MLIVALSKVTHRGRAMSKTRSLFASKMSRTADLPEFLKDIIKAEQIGALAFFPLVANDVAHWQVHDVL